MRLATREHAPGTPVPDWVDAAVNARPAARPASEAGWLDAAELARYARDAGLVADKPEWDGTPSAHPAYWRGRAARPATTAGGEEPRL